MPETPPPTLHTPPTPPRPAPSLPYKIACLCDLRDERGRILLLRRAKAPNEGLCSPIGGKLDMGLGESPAQCARREIMEEAGVDVPIERLHLMGLISERAYEGQANWLIFYYRVLGPVSVQTGPMGEGVLEWHEPGDIAALPIPETDRRIIWPLVNTIERAATAAPGQAWARPGFFAVHIDCKQGTSGDEPAFTWTVEQQS